MNGRIFDSRLGRFLSADPLIQAPENLQSFNRYSYVFNNSLTHTDPSGFETKKKSADASAATSSTQLAEAVSSTEISSQDNVGGEDGSESSAQVDDYYTDGSGYTQVDSTSNPTTTVTKPGDEKIGSTANSNDTNTYGIGTKDKAGGTSWYQSAWGWAKSNAKKAAKKAVGVANDIVDSDAYAYVSSWAGAIGGVQTAVQGGVVVTVGGAAVPGLQIPGGAMVAKGIGDASLNVANIQIMHFGGGADDLVPSSTISATTSAIGAGVDAVTGGGYNAQGKGEVMGDIGELLFSASTGNLGTGLNKAMNLAIPLVEIADSITEEW